jgi:hypothetical protein
MEIKKHIIMEELGLEQKSNPNLSSKKKIKITEAQLIKLIELLDENKKKNI